MEKEMLDRTNEIRTRIEELKKEKDFVLLAHYYVDGAVQEIADYVGSTSEIIAYANKSTTNDMKDVLEWYFTGIREL